MAQWRRAISPGDPENTRKTHSEDRMVARTCLAKRMCTRNCNAIWIATKKPATRLVIELARRNRLPLLATNGVCHATPARREVSDVFTCIRNHVRLETAGRLLAQNSERYLKSGAMMAEALCRSAGSDRQYC